MNRRSSLSAVVYVLLVFVSGMLVGVFSYRLYMVRTVQSSTQTQPPRNPEEYRKRVIEEMTARLKLSAGQVDSLQKIMDETRQRYRDARERQRPELRAIEEAQHASVRAILNDQQKADYEKMRVDRERRREAERKKQGL